MPALCYGAPPFNCPGTSDDDHCPKCGQCRHHVLVGGGDSLVKAFIDGLYMRDPSSMDPENFGNREYKGACEECGRPIYSGWMKVYLDDEREAPEGWFRVHWPEEAIVLLERGLVAHISLDHDLGDDEHGTGYDVILWLEEAVATRGFEPPEISIHTANPSARKRMEAGAERIRRLAE
jgi:hypothetical protein